MYIALFDARKIYNNEVLPILNNNDEQIVCDTKKEIKEKLRNSIFYGILPYCILNLDKLQWKI